MITVENAAFLRRRRTYIELLWKAIFNPQQRRLVNMMAQHIEPGKAVIDVGANVGYYTRGFAKRAAGGAVLAFEPQSAPRAILTVASFFQRNYDILIFPLALADEEGLFALKIPLKAKHKVGVGLAHIAAEDDLKDRFEVKCELIACQRLDTVLEQVDVGPISLIKIDVEGGELGVLQGADRCLAAHRPSVICELQDYTRRFGTSTEDILAFFAARDYVPCKLDSGRPLPAGEIEPNTLFRPKERL